jgi:hypothetical protein
MWKNTFLTGSVVLEGPKTRVFRQAKVVRAKKRRASTALAR